MTERLDPRKNWLSSSDSALRYAFGTSEPTVARFPHCIFPDGSGTLGVVAEVVGEPLGIWGNALPRFDASGDSYVPSWNDAVEFASDFYLWQLPANQDIILQRRERPLEDFVMIISADTPPAILEHMYRSDFGKDGFTYDKCLELLADWIKDLKWAYVTLEPESDFAMFVTAPTHEQTVQTVEEELKHSGIAPVFRIAWDDRHPTWTGPLFPE